MPGTRRVVHLALVAVLLTATSARASTTGMVGATVVVSPLGVALVVTPGSAAAGKPVRARAEVRNLGAGAIGPVLIELRYEPVGLEVRGTVTQEVRRIAAERSASVTWQLRGVVPGSYVMLARATTGPFTTESEAVLLTILPVRP